MNNETFIDQHNNLSLSNKDLTILYTCLDFVLFHSNIANEEFFKNYLNSDTNSLFTLNDTLITYLKLLTYLKKENEKCQLEK